MKRIILSFLPFFTLLQLGSAQINVGSINISPPGSTAPGGLVAVELSGIHYITDGCQYMDIFDAYILESEFEIVVELVVESTFDPDSPFCPAVADFVDFWVEATVFFSDTAPPGTYCVTVLPADVSISPGISDEDRCVEVVLPCQNSGLALVCGEQSPASNPGSSDGVGSIAISGGTPGYTIAWSGAASGSQMQASGGTATITGLPAGSYSMTVTDANNCVQSCFFTIMAAGGACTHPDYAALMALYDATDGPNWTNNTGWAAGAAGMDCEPCNWYGVSCDAMGRVAGLDLTYNQLAGTIPVEIGELASLRSLFLTDNALTGSLPATIGNLTNLENLNVGINQLSGDLPASLFSLAQLQRLFLFENNFSGSLPSSVGNLPNLIALGIYGNDFSGPLPASLGNLTNLIELTLAENNFSGPIPEGVGQLNNLLLCYLNDNELTGCFHNSLFGSSICGLGFNGAGYSIPGYNFTNNPALPWGGDFNRFCDGEDQIGASCDDGDGSNINDLIHTDCTCRSCRQSDSLALVDFYNATNGPNWTNSWDLNQPVSTWYGVNFDAQEDCLTSLGLNNNNLSGMIPAGLTLAKLQSLDLSQNALSGPLPDFSGMPALEFIALFENDYSGSIPDTLNLPELYHFDVDNNRLEGALPAFAGTPKLQYLDVQHNQITGEIPDLSHLTYLYYLSLFRNRFGSLVPDFSILPALDSFSIAQNRLTFEDLLPHHDQISAALDFFDYTQQDSFYQDTIIEISLGSTIEVDLFVDFGLTGNTYDWFKDGAFETTIIGDNTRSFTNITLEDEGIYHVLVTNPGLPNLTLRSHAIRLRVSDCEDSLACRDQVMVTLSSVNCQFTLNPDMLLEGTFDCFTTSDFEITVVDSNPANGAIVDEAGIFTYTISADTSHPGIGFFNCFGTIITEDANPPAPVCINGLSLELAYSAQGGGTATVFATDFLANTIADCSEPIAYSINRAGTPNNSGQNSMGLNCSDVGTVIVEVWAYDAAGNRDFCETSILVQDNLDYCNGGSTTITGGITMETGESAACTLVELSGEVSATTEAYANGMYAFSNLPDAEAYTVTPYNNTDPLNGVSSFDIELINRHIMGTQLLDSPYKLIAADTDNNGRITTLDVIGIRRLILGLSTAFRNNSSWRFVPLSYTFPDPSNPWAAPFPESIAVNSLPPGGVSDADFVAIKIGDVNNSAVLPGDACPVPAGLAITVDDAVVSQGATFCVPVRAAQFSEVAAMQFTLSYDPSRLSYAGVLGLNANLIGFAASNFASPSAGLISVAWSAPSSSVVSLPDGAVLFELCFEATAAGESQVHITSDAVPIAFEDGNGSPILATVVSGNISVQPAGVELAFAPAHVELQPGDPICMSITVEQFNDIVGMSFTVAYQPEQLIFTELQNLNPNLPNFSVAGNFGTPDTGLPPGFVTVTWFDPQSLSPVNLPDGAVLFDLCFQAANCGSSALEINSAVTSVEFVNSDQDLNPSSFTPGTVRVSQDFCRAVQLDLSEEVSGLNGSACVKVRTMDFRDISNLQLSIGYDEQRLLFANTANLNLPGLGGSNFVPSTPGVIEVDWSAAAPASLNDGSTAFELCFTTQEVGTAALDFSGPIVIRDESGRLVEFTGSPGAVDIASSPPVGTLAIKPGSAALDFGESACLPVAVDNFTAIVGMSFTLTYDADLLAFEQAVSSNGGLAGFGLAANISNPSPGLIAVSWFDQGLNATTLPNDAVLFELCFRAEDCGISTLGISGDWAPVEFSNANGDIVPTAALPGTLTIGNCVPPQIVSAEVVDVSCVGEADGRIALAVEAGLAPYRFSWSNGQDGESINGLSPGTYSVTVLNALGDLNAVATYTIAEPDELGLSAVITAPFCDSASDGTLSLSIIGGTPGYTITWDSGLEDDRTDFSELPSGQYCATVTDANGCQQAACFEVPAGGASSISVPIVATLCPGEGLSINGRLYDANNPSGTEVLTAANGCDSVVDISLSFYPDNTTILDAAFCAGQSYEYQGQPYGQAGDYPFVFTAANGCDSTVILRLEQVPAPTVNIAGTTPANCNQATGGITLNVSGTTGTPTYQWSNGATTPNLSNVTAGSYTVTVTSGNGCTATASANVPGTNAPTVSIASTTPAACSQPAGSVTLNVSGTTGTSTYLWSNGATTPNLSNVAAGSYTVTVTSGNGCTATASANVPGTNVPTITIANTIPANCDQAVGGVTLNVSGETGTPTYLWSNDATTQNLSNVAAGSYSVTVTSGNGCTATASANVPGTNAPTVSIANTPPADCNQATGGVTINVSGTTGTPTYLWSNGATTQNLSNVTAGSYSVTVTSGNGCTATVSANVPGTNVPTITIANTIPANCDQAVGGVTLNVSGATGTPTYIWSNGATTPNLSNVTAGSYSVTVTSGNGCTATASANVPGTNAPTVSIASTTPAACSQPTGRVTLNVSGATGTPTYLWSNGATTPTLSNVTAGSYSVTVTSGNGCTATASANVPGTDAPTVTIANTIPANCDQAVGGVTLNVSGATGTPTYLWSNGATTPTLSNVTAGSYTVTVTSGNGCTAIASANVPGTNAPTVSIASTAPAACSQPIGSITLNVSGTAGTPTYLWSNGATTPDLSNVAAGNYSVTVTSGNGCTAMASAMVPGTDVPTVSIAGTTPADCGEANGAVSINVSGIVGTPAFVWSNGTTTQNIASVSAGTYTVTVTSGNGCTATASVEVPDTGPLRSELEETLCAGGELLFGAELLSESGLYYDTLVSQAGCDSIVALTLEISVSDTFRVDDAICSGDVYTFGNVSIANSGQYAQIFTSQLGCDSIVVLNLEVLDGAVLEAVPDDYLLTAGERSARFSLVENDALPPEWSIELSRQPLHGTATLTAAGELEYTLTDPAFLGVDSFAYRLCTEVCGDTCAEAAIRISVLRDCLSEIEASLPNAFTPDGDGINDYFDPLADVRDAACLQNPGNARLTIVNRWGEVVFDAKDYRPWDGGFSSGRRVPQGAYYYLLSFELGEKTLLRGTVHVMLLE